MKNQRDNYLDLLKGISIISVILGHCIQYGSGEDYIINRLFFENILFKIIYSFHMPLFTIVSGYLFNFTLEKLSLKELLKNRILRLIVPILIWGGINFIIYLILHKIKYEVSIKIIKILLNNIIYNLWFLWAILGCSGIITIYRKVLKKDIFNLILIIMFFILPDSYNFKYVKYLYPYFLLGYFFNKNYDKIKYYLKNFNFLDFLIFFIYIFLLKNYKFEYYIYNSTFYIINEDYIIIYYALYRWIIGLFGIILVSKFIYIFKNKNTYLIKSIEFLGKISLELYILSYYINIYILLPLTKNMKSNLILNLIETIIVIYLCLFIKYVLYQNQFIYKLIFGKIKF